MKKVFVGVKLPSDLLAKIDSEGVRSDVIRKALFNHFAEDKNIGIKQVLNGIEDIKTILKHQSEVHVHLPDSFNIKSGHEPKRLGFWNRLFGRGV